MDQISNADFDMLLNRHNEEPCVSIFMPTHRAAGDLQGDNIRFKTLLYEAREQLQSLGMQINEATEMLAGAFKLVDERPFWQEQSDGLAMFIAPGFIKGFRLPLSFKPQVIVSHSFHLKPIMQLDHASRPFFILAISQNEVRVMRATQQEIWEVDVPEIPRSLAEAMKYEELEQNLQLHSTGGGSAVFHGQGVPESAAKNRILRFFQQVASGLDVYLRNEKAPLVFAGVEYLFPIYREASSYPNLLQKALAGNVENMSLNELRSKAFELVRPIFEKDRNIAIDQYYDLSDEPITSEDIQEVLPAAEYGRVQTLFVAADEEKWGKFDEERNEIELHDDEEPGDDDLLNLAAIETIKNGGAVYALPKEQIPSGKPVAAVFRY